MLVFFLISLVISIIITITILLLILTLSTVKISIDNLEILNKKIDYKIFISLYFLGKIKYANFTLSNKLIEKINIKQKIKEINLYELEKNYKHTIADIKNYIQKLHLNINKFNMNLSIGIEDVIITTAIIVFTSTIIPIFLRKCIKKYKQKDYYYQINPIYTNENIIKLKLNCIINTKMVHIIHVIYIFLIKRRGFKNERTSNRRAYDNCHE